MDDPAESGRLLAPTGSSLSTAYCEGDSPFPREGRSPAPLHPRSLGSVLEVLWVALRLGLTSFGGPIAHLGYFRQEYVVRRKWVDEGSYADVVALCQFLPGPASSQVGITMGIVRAGLPGGLAAWLGFTLPSAIAMVQIGRAHV